MNREQAEATARKFMQGVIWTPVRHTGSRDGAIGMCEEQCISDIAQALMDADKAAREDCAKKGRTPAEIRDTIRVGLALGFIIWFITWFILTQVSP